MLHSIAWFWSVNSQLRDLDHKSWGVNILLPKHWEDPQEKGMATHSSILVWEIPWTEEPGGLQSMGLQRVRHSWVTNTFTLFSPPTSQLLKSSYFCPRPPGLPTDFSLPFPDWIFLSLIVWSDPSVNPQIYPGSDNSLLPATILVKSPLSLT